MLPVCRQDVADPEPHRHKVEGKEHNEEDQQAGRNRLKDSPGSHKSDKGSVKTQPNEGYRQHFAYICQQKGRSFRLAAPENLLSFGEHAFDYELFGILSRSKVLFIEFCHLFSSFLHCHLIIAK